MAPVKAGIHNFVQVFRHQVCKQPLFVVGKVGILIFVAHQEGNALVCKL